MFGVNVSIGKINGNPSFINGEVDNVLKRNEERKVFRQFLDSKDSQGNVILNELVRSSETETERQIEGGLRVERSILLEFAVSSLKGMTNSHLSFYDLLIRKIIEDQHPKFKTLHGALDRDKFDGRLPFGYPDASKKAAGILTAKIKDSLDKIEPEFLKRKIFGEKVRHLSKEMFYGINKLGLADSNLIAYLGIIYELSLIKEAPFQNNETLRKIIGNSLKEGDVLNLVYLKCLRFAYPKSGGVRVIPNMKDFINNGIQGRVLLKSEKNLKLKLGRIRQIFKNRDIAVNFVICIADEDLDLLFPPGNSFIDSKGLSVAKFNIGQYTNSVQECFGDNFEITTTNSLAAKTNGAYQELRREVLKDIKSHGGRFIEPNFFERSRVDYQHSFYQKLLGSKFLREEARRTAEEQITSVIALQELLKLYSGRVILVEESRGDENKLIANGSVPIIFTKLRDEAKFDVE